MYSRTLSLILSRTGVTLAALAAMGMLLAAACTPDLHETAGPIVPVPNLTGQVVRGGLPVSNHKVKLEIPDADSTVAEDRTDAGGRYEFTAVPAGAWLVKVASTDPGDFASVSCEVLVRPDQEPLEAPDLDLSLGGLEMLEPEDGEARPRPNPRTPVEFTWEPPADPDREVQVRVAEANGEAVWYSEKQTDGVVPWNGLGNRGVYLNRLVPAGSYSWRLRVEIDDSTLEYTTATRRLTVTD